ncbi:MAG TPA: diacylglycerol kinase family protein [Candidatus Acidoferrales bacterium]|nr:diacylglycerol kinase family protein [Candidatus Acidoferrales bacterium]
MLDGIRNAVIIHNPAAGGRRSRRTRQLEQARKILARAGIESELQATTGMGTATGLARLAVEERRQLVIICGGDGTVNEAVNGLVGSQVPLAVLPAGTANVLAKELGIPWDIPRAAEWVLRGTRARIALGVATPLREPALRRFFLCVAGAGTDARMVYSVSWALKQRAGILAYWFEAFRQLFLYDFPRFRASANGRELEATLVIVGRTKHYGGPFRITTGADLFEDGFELAACTTRSGLRYLTYVPIIWLGQLRRMRDVHFLKATRLRCEPLDNRPIYAQVDGEVAGQLPIEFSIEPDALTLVVPTERRTLHSPG